MSISVTTGGLYTNEPGVNAEFCKISAFSPLPSGLPDSLFYDAHGMAVHRSQSPVQQPAPLLHEHIGSIGRNLGESFRSVLNALPSQPTRPSEVARELRLNRDISSRLMNGLNADDPLATAHAMPGPEPLRRVLRAAKRHGVPAELIEAGEVAVRHFESLIRDELGDRDSLDALLSSMLPDVRPKFELASRQMAFKGISLLKGAQADAWLHTAFLHPSSVHDDKLDVAFIYGTLGLRRLRPNMVVKFSFREFGVPQSAWQTIDGLDAADASGDELDEFCERVPAMVSREAIDEGVVYALDGNPLGPKNAVDKLLGEVRPAAFNRFAADHARARKSMFVAPSVPVRSLIFDLLLHESITLTREPELVFYDTAVDGMASVNDATRDVDRLELDERIEYLGMETRLLQITELPRYIPMLKHLCEQRGWTLHQFRAYRCRMQYPMHGLQACMAFDVPTAPSR